MRILERVQKTPSPNLPQLFVQLSPLVDVVSAIASKSPDKVEAIVERQAPVFDSPAKTKDIIHTLTENLKSELVRWVNFTRARATIFNLGNYFDSTVAQNYVKITFLLKKRKEFS
jgi:hypothetical protein